MKPGNKNSYKALKSININGKDYKYYSLAEAEKNGLKNISKLPKSLKVLLENLLRYEDDLSVTKDQIEALENWVKEKKSTKYVEGVSCPKCHDYLTESQKDRFAMRQKQILAAKKMGKKYIFQKEYF